MNKVCALTVASIGQVQDGRKRKTRMRHGTMRAGEKHGGLYGRTCTGGYQNETAGARNVAKSVPRICDYHAIPGIFLGVSENGVAGFWNDHDSLHAKKRVFGIEVAENVFVGVPGFGDLLRERGEQDAAGFCGSYEAGMVRGARRVLAARRIDDVGVCAVAGVCEGARKKGTAGLAGRNGMAGKAT
jgi:hypothetical protein